MLAVGNPFFRPETFSPFFFVPFFFDFFGKTRGALPSNRTLEGNEFVRHPLGPIPSLSPGPSSHQPKPLGFTCPRSGNLFSPLDPGRGTVVFKPPLKVYPLSTCAQLFSELFPFLSFLQDTLPRFIFFFGLDVWSYFFFFNAPTRYYALSRPGFYP